MCPVCILTAAAIVSSSTSAGGLGALLFKRSRARRQENDGESRQSELLPEAEEKAGTSPDHPITEQENPQ